MDRKIKEFDVTNKERPRIRFCYWIRWNLPFFNQDKSASAKEDAIKQAATIMKAVSQVLDWTYCNSGRAIVDYYHNDLSLIQDAYKESNIEQFLCRVRDFLHKIDNE